MRSRSWDFQSEKSGIFVAGVEGLSSINEGVLGEDVSLDSSGFSVVSEDFLGDQQWEGALVIGSLESKRNMNGAWLSEVSDFTSQIGGRWSWGRFGWQLSEEHFFIDQINEFLMIFNTSGSNNNFVRSNKGVLEVLDNISCQVGNIAFISVQFAAQTILTEGSQVDGIIEGLISSKMWVKLMTLLIFMHTNTGCNKVLRLECAISHHGEDIDNIMWEAVGSVESRFSIEIHFELTTGHLCNAVVDCFVGVKGCF